jgi:hypothetical protein
MDRANRTLVTVCADGAVIDDGEVKGFKSIVLSLNPEIRFDYCFNYRHYSCQGNSEKASVICKQNLAIYHEDLVAQIHIS